MIVFSTMSLASTDKSIAQQERRVTHASQPHVLTNINAWSPDGEWIVYDVRSGSDFDGSKIERVHVRTGEVECLYESANGAQCGVVTYSPVDPQVVFIVGPENPTADWNYHFTRRRGALVDDRRPGVARPLDAMNYAPPFREGALRGGSHVHVFSPDGRYVSFTYEDEVLAQLGAASEAPPHEPNQRNVGVTVLGTPVTVASTHPRNNGGDGFSVIVTRTVANPRPGSDDISKAFEEGWVGREGYRTADGALQRALAFQGLVMAPDGRSHAEVFIVDLPADLTRSGTAPLAGTTTTRPAPPAGTAQRRLTFTAERRFPGVAPMPRHWLRASPDGSSVGFLMADDVGVVQLWTVSPRGGEMRQITRNPVGVSSASTWNPDGERIAHVMDGSVCETRLDTGETTRLTARDDSDSAPLALACVYSPDGNQIAYLRPIGEFNQIFVVASNASKKETN